VILLAGLAILWIIALAWTVLTVLHAIALRPDAQATRMERLSCAWPLTGALPLAGLSISLAGPLHV